MKKLWYSWEEMRRDVNVLCRDITLDKFNPEVIVGISRGGLTPGVMVSHWMQKPFKAIKAALRDYPEWEDYLPRKTDKRVLIVDDVCDSGVTFEKIKKYIEDRKKNEVDVRFATLWWNNECNFEPHYHVQNCAKDSEDIWIHFPWEQWWNAPV
jgi:hypoxanthine phosphoribosyltransferase